MATTWYTTAPPAFSATVPVAPEEITGAALTGASLTSCTVIVTVSELVNAPSEVATVMCKVGVVSKSIAPATLTCPVVALMENFPPALSSRLYVTWPPSTSTACAAYTAVPTAAFSVTSAVAPEMKTGASLTPLNAASSILVIDPGPDVASVVTSEIAVVAASTDDWFTPLSPE